MKRIELAGEWKLRKADANESVPARVPGDNCGALLRAGRIPDPDCGTQENDVQWVAEEAWVFERDFEVDPSWFDQASIYLNCDSLDTLAEVRFNDAAAVLARLSEQWAGHARARVQRSGAW
jgi:beta-galactosidase/beta-glucuronidase